MIKQIICFWNLLNKINKNNNDNNLNTDELFTNGEASNRFSWQKSQY
jgi:hypothetical protein